MNKYETGTFILTAEDVRAVALQVGVDALMDEMIGRLEVAFKSYDDDLIAMKPRNGFSYHHPETGLVEWMPIMLSGRQVTIKVVGYHPCNPQSRQLPTILSTVSAYDTLTGHLECLADATFVTALRTGAASAIASRLLARPGSSVLGLIGCGAQAVTQLHALSRQFEIEDVLYYDQDKFSLENFEERAAFVMPQPNMRAASIEELVSTADILCTATSVAVGCGPVFQDRENKSWLHINAVGSDFPGKTEVPYSLLRRSFVCPDYLPQAKVEGECQQLEEKEIGADLISVAKSEADFQSRQDQLTVFDSTGFALEDHVALTMLVDLAREVGVGTAVRLESIANDPQNPYSIIAGSA